MKKIEMYATYCYEDDTKLTFSMTGNRAEIELSFTSEDEDYGTETLVYTGDADKTLMSLCEEQLAELTTFLDETCDGTWRPDSIVQNYKHLDDLNNSSLIAFERMLQTIVSGSSLRRSSSGKNKYGHEYMIDRIGAIAYTIRKKFMSGEVSAVYISTDEYETGMDPDNGGYWYKIVKIDLPFDNNPDEIALLMGYCGGGNVTFAYKYTDDDDSWLDEQITEMIVTSTGESKDTKVYVEFIGKNDEHSYE